MKSSADSYALWNLRDLADVISLPSPHRDRNLWLAPTGDAVLRLSASSGHPGEIRCYPVFPDPTTYDESARYLLLRAGAGLLSWLLRLSPGQVRFDGWIQSQLTLPGVKQRLCDGIAHLADLERGEAPFAALVEVQTRPDGTMPGRLLLAGGLCLLLLKPTPLPGDRYELTAVVINLTGKGNSRRNMVLGDTQWILVPCEVDVESLDAGTILKEIASGSAPRELLALIPLIKRGSHDDIIISSRPGWMSLGATTTLAGVATIRWRWCSPKRSDAGRSGKPPSRGSV